MNAFTRRSVLAAALTGAGAVALTACGGEKKSSATAGGATTDDLKTIVVGYIADGNGATITTVAEKLGLWKKHGLEVQLKSFNNGPLQIQALGTGDLDFGYIGSGAMWLPMQGKAKIVSLNSLGTADRVVAQPGIATFKDLKGKKVGVPEGTSGDMLLNMALEKNGMTVNDIQRVPMDPPTVISAFSSGQIEGAAIWYPHVATMKKQVPDLVEVVKSTDFPDLAFPAAEVAGVNILEDPEKLKRFQAVVKEALAWAAANREELVKELAKALKQPEEALKSEQQYVEILSPDELTAKIKDGTADTWLKNLNTQFVKSGKLKEEADPKSYFLSQEYIDS
ncbi:aliphatic sulfonate ABC transporter substrate-binding protein [Dermabacteraceae bacterium P7074]